MLFAQLVDAFGETALMLFIAIGLGSPLVGSIFAKLDRQRPFSKSWLTLTIYYGLVAAIFLAVAMGATKYDATNRDLAYSLYLLVLLGPVLGIVLATKRSIEE